MLVDFFLNCIPIYFLLKRKFTDSILKLGEGEKASTLKSYFVQPDTEDVIAFQ